MTSKEMDSIPNTGSYHKIRARIHKTWQKNMTRKKGYNNVCIKGNCNNDKKSCGKGEWNENAQRERTSKSNEKFRSFREAYATIKTKLCHSCTKKCLENASFIQDSETTAADHQTQYPSPTVGIGDFFQEISTELVTDHHTQHSSPGIQQGNFAQESDAQNVADHQTQYSPPVNAKDNAVQANNTEMGVDHQTQYPSPRDKGKHAVDYQTQYPTPTKDDSMPTAYNVLESTEKTLTTESDKDFKSSPSAMDVRNDLKSQNRFEYKPQYADDYEERAKEDEKKNILVMLTKGLIIKRLAAVSISNSESPIKSEILAECQKGLNFAFLELNKLYCGSCRMLKLEPPHSNGKLTSDMMRNLTSSDISSTSRYIISLLTYLTGVIKSRCNLSCLPFQERDSFINGCILELLEKFKKNESRKAYWKTPTYQEIIETLIKNWQDVRNRR